MLRRRREPILNLPPATVGLVVLIAAIEFIQSNILDEWQSVRVLLDFAFIPARYGMNGADFPGGLPAQVWTFLSYALLHGDWTHCAVNALWLIAFGSALERRFGALRFILFSAVCAIAGAATHLAFHFGEAAPVVGASAAISGQMAAAARFAFARGAPLGGLGPRTPADYHRPATPLLATFADRRILVFLVVFFAVNLFIGLGSISIGTGGARVAWEAHLGGFVAGLLLFPVFDPVPRGDGGHRQFDSSGLP